jgi:hypothetical protein
LKAVIHVVVRNDFSLFLINVWIFVIFSITKVLELHDYTILLMISLLFYYVYCTQGFHCDISIHAYSVLYSNSPPRLRIPLLLIPTVKQFLPGFNILFHALV